MLKRLLSGVLAVCVAATAQAEDLTIGYMYPSPITDVGWVRQLELGREAVEEAYGDRVTSLVVESVPEGPDAARVMRQFVSEGAEFLVLGSFGYMNDGLRLAQGQPDVSMIHASGFRNDDNFGTFTARNYEGFYLTGMAAGMMTESGVIGVIGAFPIPELVAELNALTLAVRRYRPDATINVVWIDTWFDPPRAQEAARAHISQGADVLFSLHQDTPSVVSVAEAEGVYVVNTSSDMSQFAPNATLAAVTNDWSEYFVRVVGDHLDGTFSGTDERGGLTTGMVEVVAWSEDLSDAQMAEIMAMEQAFIDGTAHPFSGPITDQDGVLRVAEGEVLPDAEIFSMNWLVDAVTGSLGN